MNIIKKILPYAAIALTIVCTAMTIKWSVAVDEMQKCKNMQDMQDEIVTLNAEYEPVDITLKFDNTNPKFENGGEIEAYDFLKSFRHEYVSEDIHFVSSIEGWEEEKLQEAAEELSKNLHGEEMKYVNAVMLEEGNGRYCYGTNYKGIMHYDAPATLYNFFPKKGIYKIPKEVSFLTVSNVTKDLDVADIAQAMSVAYGYHFTQFNMDISGTEDDAETEYYNLRAEGDDRIILEVADNDQYMNNYVWYLEQIAAYDYMFLMGSPNANRILTEFPHMTHYPYESMDEVYQTFDATYANGRNTTPHANLSLTMPDRVVGLMEYFYSFVDKDMPEYTLKDDMGSINFESKLAKLNSSIRRVINVKVFEVSWDVPYDDENVKYSIVKTNLKDEIISTRYINIERDNHSIKIDQPAIRAFGIYKYYFNMRLDREYKLYLIAAFPDGSITVSEPIELIYPDEEWDS